MALAVNYSLPLEELILAGAVQVDKLKCPEWKGIVVRALKTRPVYIHAEIALGNGSVRKLDFAHLREMLESVNNPYVNTHLGAPAHADGKPSITDEELLVRWQQDLALLREQLPGYQVICENLPGMPYLPELEQAANPDLIHQFLTENDCGLLLDISHARMTSFYCGYDWMDYIRRLPMERLQELHVTGIKDYRGIRTDHFELVGEDWDVARWAADQIKTGQWQKPVIVAFEYGGVGEVFRWRCDERHLRDQVPLLYELFHAV